VRGCSDTVHFFGFGWRALVLTLVSLTVGFSVHLLRAGPVEVADEWSVLISFTLAPLGALVVIALLWNLAWTPVRIHRSVTKEVCGLRQRWDNEKPRLLIRGAQLEEQPDFVGRRVLMMLAMTNLGGRDVKRLRIRSGRANENEPSQFIPMRALETRTVIPPNGPPVPIRLQPMIIQYERDESGNLIIPTDEGRYAVYARVTFWDERDEEYEQDVWMVYIPSNYTAARGVSGLADAPESLIGRVEPHMLVMFGPLKA